MTTLGFKTCSGRRAPPLSGLALLPSPHVHSRKRPRQSSSNASTRGHLGKDSCTCFALYGDVAELAHLSIERFAAKRQNQIHAGSRRNDYMIRIACSWSTPSCLKDAVREERRRGSLLSEAIHSPRCFRALSEHATCKNDERTNLDHLSTPGSVAQLLS